MRGQETERERDSCDLGSEGATGRSIKGGASGGQV